MERAAFEKLSLQHLDAVYRLAMQLVRHPDEAAELVQETYLKALRAAARFEERGGGIRPWLFKILHNVFYSRLNRNAAALAVDDLDRISDDAPGPGEPMPGGDLAGMDWEQIDDRLKHAIERLRPEYRTALLLWAVEGLKYREIAEIQEIPIGTVMSRLHRARSILAEQLAEMAEESGASERLTNEARDGGPPKYNRAAHDGGTRAAMTSDLTSRNFSLYCDGELSPEEARRIEAEIAASPGLQAQVEFQRTLKDRVGTVLKADAGTAPADLAGRIRERIAAEPGPALAAPAAAPALVEVPPRRAAAWWRAQQRANIFAIAATLALVGGAVLVGIFGPSIDSWGGRSSVDATAEAAAAVAGEHALSTTDLSAAQQGWRYRTADETTHELAPLLGAIGHVVDLSDVGYEFAGGGVCNVPHCKQGCHLFYRHAGDQPGLISLTVVADGPHIDLHTSPEIPLPIPTELIREGPGCVRDVWLWTHGQRVYMLVACVPEDALPAARRMQEAIRASERHGN